MSTAMSESPRERPARIEDITLEYRKLIQNERNEQIRTNIERGAIITAYILLTGALCYTIYEAGKHI